MVIIADCVLYRVIKKRRIIYTVINQSCVTQWATAGSLLMFSKN